MSKNCNRTEEIRQKKIFNAKSNKKEISHIKNLVSTKQSDL